MPEKRKYTFRKDRIIPVASGSLSHEIEKEQREGAKRLKKSGFF